MSPMTLYLAGAATMVAAVSLSYPVEGTFLAGLFITGAAVGRAIFGDD